MGSAGQEATDIAFVRARTGMVHVSDPEALAAFTDGRGTFDVDPHCRKLDAFVAKHKLECRLASEDLLSEFFSLDKDSRTFLVIHVFVLLLIHVFLVSPLSLNAERFPRVTTVVDASLATEKVPLAVRASSSSETVFLSGSDILAYLRNLETAEVKVHEIDFVALKSGLVDGIVTQAKPAEKKEKKAEKEDAKIEGAVQIAIGVKKEVDFAAWYTNVSISSYLCPLLVIHHAE